MNYPYHLLPELWLWIVYALYGAIMLGVIMTAPWRWLLTSAHSHIYLGACVGLLVLWSIRTDGIPGMEYHYLGATLLTLMVGWRLATVGMSLVLTAIIFNGASTWVAFPVNALLMGVIPVVTSQLVYYYVDKKLPNNFFIYIFLVAFFGSALAVASSVLSASGLLMLSGEHALQLMALRYIPYTPLIMFAEAFMTGMLITIFVVMCPSWVSTFDDDRYIKGK